MELLQQCDESVVVAFHQGLRSFHKILKYFLVSTNGNSLDGDSVVELV
jgi:hypothetical protein